MLKEYNLVELFSGIGSQAKALENLGIKVNTLGTCEWDVHAIAAYDIIHKSEVIPNDILAMEKEQLLAFMKDYTFSNSGKSALDFDSFKTYSKEALQRIYISLLRNNNFVDIKELKGSQLPNGIDILTYSFPCQDLSNVGAFHGYNKGIDKDSGSRSSLLWQVGRILTEMCIYGVDLPRFLLMENVPTLLSIRHRKNFFSWINDLEALGYISKYFQLNACDFGLPQNRLRLLMISVYVGQNEQLKRLVKDFLQSQDSISVIENYRSSPFFHDYKISDLLRTDYSNSELYEEAKECTPNDTVSRRKIWEDNPQIVLPGDILNQNITTIRTITTKQDRNPNSGNLFFNSGIEGRSNFRYLTPRECMLFMGFTDEDYCRLKNHNIQFHKGDSLFARDKIIRMTGNSIPVKLLEGVFLQILLIDELMGNYQNRANHILSETNRKDPVAIIKSYLFSKGIRSRITDKEYPQGATIIYPKYKTAIYVKNCFLHGHTCHDPVVSCDTQSIWNNITKRNREFDLRKMMEAINLGWNALLIWECELESNTYDTLEWIKSALENQIITSNAKGRILSRGR